MMDLKIRLGNKLLGEITEYLEGLAVDNPENKAHEMLQSLFYWKSFCNSTQKSLYFWVNCFKILLCNMFLCRPKLHTFLYIDLHTSPKLLFSSLNT